MGKLLYHIHPDIYIGVHYKRAFLLACKKGHLEMGKLLYQIKPEIIESAHYENGFIFACASGHLNVAQWLYEIKLNINISACNDAFRNACKNGHLNVAQWLYEMSNDHIINWEIISIPIDKSKNIYINELSKCPMCVTSDINIQTNCGHSYCLACIKEWHWNNKSYEYNKLSKYPMCRQQITHVHHVLNKH
jgi:hypothetical protein